MNPTPPFIPGDTPMKTVGEVTGAIIDGLGAYDLPAGWTLACATGDDALAVVLRKGDPSEPDSKLTFAVCLCPKHLDGAAETARGGMDRAVAMISASVPKPALSTRDSVLKFLRAKRA